MDNTMIFILLFGGMAVALFLIAYMISPPHTEARTEKPHKAIVYTYVTAIVFILLSIIIFLLSPYTAEDLILTIMEL